MSFGGKGYLVVCCCFNKSASVNREECQDWDVNIEVLGNHRSQGMDRVPAVRLAWKLRNSDLLLSEFCAVFPDSLSACDKNKQNKTKKNDKILIFFRFYNFMDLL